MKFVENILILIKRDGINKNQLSIQTGISSGLISDWISGKKEPSLKSTLKIAEYFNVSLDYLVGRSDDPNINKRTAK